MTTTVAAHSTIITAKRDLECVLSAWIEDLNVLLVAPTRSAAGGSR